MGLGEMWLRHVKHWECLWANWEDLQMRHPQQLVDRISDRGREAVIRNNISLICSILSPGCSSPSHSLPSSHEIHKPVLDGVRKKLVTHSSDSQALTCSHFPPWEKSWAEKVDLGIELCHLGRGVMWVKWNCSSYMLQCVRSERGFYCPNGVLELLYWTPKLLQRHLICEWLSKQVPFGERW